MRTIPDTSSIAVTQSWQLVIKSGVLISLTCMFSSMAYSKLSWRLVLGIVNKVLVFSMTAKLKDSLHLRKGEANALLCKDIRRFDLGI